ncbi:unnamed protein product [Owenia fusiformis]|uniref:Kinesin-like protein 6 n=1 Tax=Owenia fusiformis TaxID=6347 RepID=A0A8S4P2P4_OWEFU|nr:unnamed protein product [Owenia fusiformis]
MAENIKVAVRVRPFNEREKTMKSKLCLQMVGNTTTITDEKGGTKNFTFDYSYWSHEGFKSNADGYLEPTDSKYADQKKVFADLGQGVLDNAWGGYNCSLFAYGQTGSGKSYSMVGYGANKGIVPIVCERLFQDIDKRMKEGNKAEYQVKVSMLEIYNEQCRDLFNSNSFKVKGGLKVRNNPKKGFFVDGLSTLPVSNYADVERKMNEGTRNRTVAATQMNQTSSRAHTVVAINFTQKSPNKEGKSMTKTSIINLVDLAGSERANKTGATGDRLKEGSAINQSLSSLGNVITALAEAAEGNKKVHVPYRDSVLTKLLQNALGGNSKTVMIAALSPANVNYEETLSTLRYANRAKAIKTKAVVNESPTDKLIRELREENAKLMEMLKQGGGGDAAGASNKEEVEELKKEMEEQMKQNQNEMEAMKKTWEERLAEESKINKDKIEAEKKKQEQMKSVPHLWNLNADASLCGMVVHFCPEGDSKIGNKSAATQPDILLAGLSIHKEHAVISNKKEKVTILPVGGAKVVLNGDEIREEKQLNHHDRVMFGTSHLYIFHHPKTYATWLKNKDAKAQEPKPTFEEAQAEIAENSGFMGISSGIKSKSNKDDLILQEDLIQLLPMINETNAISEELNKKVGFEVVLVSPQARGLKEGKTEIMVKMKDLDNGNEWTWDRNKFINRKYIMQEMYMNYMEGDPDWDLPQDQDPFWEDPDTEVLIGNVHVYLSSLAFMIELEETMPITDFKGNEQGHLMLEVHPCDDKWNNIEDGYVEPADLKGQKYNFTININGARGLPSKYDRSFCTFKFYLDDVPIKCDECTGFNPNYKFKQQFTYSPVTQQLLDYIQKEALVINVWGKQKKEQNVQKSLNTRELMQREKTLLRPGFTRNESNYKMQSEVNTYRKRAERAELKINKLYDMCNKAKEKKEKNLKIEDVEGVLNSNNRFKGVARMMALIESAKDDNMGKVTSQACVLQ